MKGDNFEYMVFGWTGNQSDPAIPFLKENIKAKIPTGNKIKMINLADWSYLVLKKGEYDPLDDSFDQLLNSNVQIDVLYINGDIAYDLDSNNGRNYEEFIVMLSQVGMHWPIIINTGNHERYSKEDITLLNNSFETYGNTVN